MHSICEPLPWLAARTHFLRRSPVVLAVMFSDGLTSLTFGFLGSSL
jgi:hypothetical protein